MRVPVFKLQIVDALTEERVVFPAGGSVERELVRAIVDAVAVRPVGFWRTKATVTREVEAAVQQVLADFKRSVTRG